MTVRPILDILDPALRHPSVPVPAIGEDVQILVRDMFETMAQAHGAGLAAIQVGVPLRIFTMKPDDDRPGFVLINPVVIPRSNEEIEVEEGCLSMPGLFFPVRRAARIAVEFEDLAGVRSGLGLEGFDAVCVQHETDHLDGVRSIDRVSRLRRERLIKRHRAGRAGA
ncbi:peptide deformylase [Phenylobacterium sp.]|uniref:peptide deformylase n=1 Tax=Phenylobacterium sp. TaxID=1871053 RepID=UPI00301E576F